MVNVRMHTPETNHLAPKITVIGVGGAGGNAVNNMISSGLEGTEFVVCNTDAQALQNCLADHKIQLGENVTGGLGAGAKPEMGRAAAEESLEEVLAKLNGANMVFVTAGMGGGTGTGAAPVIARAARDQGILTVGVVTKPFHFEGTHRMKMAEQGIEEMQDYVDTLIVIPNQNLFRIANEKTTFAEAFKMADTVLQSGVRGVTDLMVMPGLINLDFADIRSAMQEMGKAMMGTGEAEGDRRAIEAAEAAISNPLLDDVSMQGARGVIINITGGYDMTLFEADEACNRIRDEVDQDANIIFGSTFDEKLEGVMRVSVVATGIDVPEAEQDGGHGDVAPGARVVSGQLSQSQRINQQTQAQQKMRVERAKPQTVQATSAFPYVARASGGTAQGQSTGQTQTQGAAALKERPAEDMFSQHNQTYARQPESAPNPAQGTNTVPRAQRVGESFIPPQPFDPSQDDGTGTQQPVQMQPQATAPAQTHNQSAYPQMRQTQQDQSQAMAQVAQAAPGASGRQENQPSQSPQQKMASNLSAQHSSGQTQARRAPQPEDEDHKSGPIGNFFSRLKGAQSHMRQEQPEGRDESQGVRSQNVENKPSQGKLNIDTPSAVPDAEYDEELDIPAFLRRQAN